MAMMVKEHFKKRRKRKRNNKKKIVEEKGTTKLGMAASILPSVYTIYYYLLPQPVHYLGTVTD